MIIAFFFFPRLQSAGRRINALARGCQGDEEKDEGSGRDICLAKIINHNLSISVHLAVFKHWASSSHTASMWAE